MFLVLLKFSGDKEKAAEFLAGHNAWIKAGFDQGVFLLVGSLVPNLGGALLIHDTSLADLKKRIAGDPFVAENIVTPEIIEIVPGKTDKRLKFLLPEGTKI